ncbi:MAG: hypothetical protein WKF77_10210 [Planctomycetaceae bacterium]
MRDLVRIADDDLQELTAGQRLRMFTAISVAVACGIVALQGMAVLFTDAKVVPLPGMNQLPGQIAWATALVAMLVAVTFLVRGVIKRRLQWAIAISLLIHFLLCLSVSVVEFRGPRPLPAAAAELPGATPEEFTLPDYAGEETPNSESEWKQQSESETPENHIDVERVEMEIADADKVKPVDATQPQDVEKLESMERQEQVKLAADAAAEMKRQAVEQELPTTQQVDSPDVAASESAQPTLEVQLDQVKQSSEAPETEREQTEIASADQQLESTRLQARRAEAAINPEDVPAEMAPKSNTAAEAAMAATEDVKVATSDAKNVDVREQQIEISRQQAAAAAGSTGEPAMNDGPTSSASPAVSRARPERAAGIGDPSTTAPAAGGSVSIARSNASGNTAAAISGADSVEVSSATGVGAPAMAESSAATSNRRGAAASVPTGSALDGSSAAAGAGQSNGQISGATVARSANGGNQPAIGNANGTPGMTGRSEGRRANAVGTNVNEIGVAAAGDNGSKNGEAMIAGPASTSVGRSASGLPARSNSSGTVSGPSGPSSSLGTQSGPSRSSTVAATGRGTEPSALLNANAGFADGANPGRSMSRSSAAIASLPTGAAAAEQSGTLVFAGPQAAAIGSAMAGSGLSGPRINSAPRRSAGLPGSSGPAADAGAPSGSNVPQPARVAVGRPRAGVGNSQPTLASADVVAGMIRKSVPGIGGSPEARIAESLSMRTSDARREAAKTLGGSPESEEAVERGLAWLALNQYPDGHWSINDFPGEPAADLGQGSFRADSAATGLALLAYLGAGYTHQSGKYQDVVNRGITWLLKRQKPDGDLFADESDFVWFYSHGMASIALCEAYGLTKDAALKEPAQKALNFIVDSQHPEFGGWRYRPKFESDTSVSGWQLMALKSGEMSGLTVPKDAYVRVGRWLDSVQSKTSAGQFSYHPSREASPTMTAEGLLMRQYLGAKRDDAQLIAGANFLRSRLPDFGQRDSYYWYYATQVMFHMQGEHWNEWNNSLRDSLVETQSKDDTGGGSWDPARPTPEKWSSAGGRHYVTCLNLLILEVYYRHLPLYLELEK